MNSEKYDKRFFENMMLLNGEDFKKNFNILIEHNAIKEDTTKRIHNHMEYVTNQEMSKDNVRMLFLIEPFRLYKVEEDFGSLDSGEK